jgi:hypothetical protein
MENSTDVPQKLETELPHDFAIPLLGIYSKDYKSAYNRDTYLHTHV